MQQGRQYGACRPALLATERCRQGLAGGRLSPFRQGGEQSEYRIIRREKKIRVLYTIWTRYRVVTSFVTHRTFRKPYTF